MNKTQESFKREAAKLDRYAQKMGQTLGSVIRLIGEEIMTDVKQSRKGHGVPVGDTGLLRGSGRVTGPEGPKKKVTLSFGGAASAYAMVQHERLDFHHDIGEPRYLVRGVERWRANDSAAMDVLKNEARKP